MEPRHGGQLAEQAAHDTGADVENESDEDEDVYRSSPRTNGRTTQSQMSVASSVPASQLLTSQDEDSQATNGGSDPPISADRLRVFRSALGQLVNTNVFQNESADVEPLVAAVNARLGRTGDGAFGLVEAGKALEGMQGRNEIM